jgi:hypothetical protein
VKAKRLMPNDWVEAHLDGIKLGQPGLPEIAAVTEYRDNVGALVQGAIEGGNVKEIAGKMNAAFQAILDKEK